MSDAQTRRQQQAQQRRNQLIDAALELFSQRGIEATRVSDIAQAAGVAQGLLYHYFPSKDALLAAIIERHGPLPLLAELLAAPPPDQPTRETLLLLANRFYALFQERRPLVRLILREIIWQPEMLRMGMLVREQALGMLARYLQSRVAAGELRPHDSLVVGQLFASNVIVVGIAALPPELYLTGAVDTLLRGILASPENAEAHGASAQTGG
ncbi:MAG TPA: helix-turn-helix domain-containing protein [Ktedonobacterales bacterium]|jgi:AcrR family transcriptional regulator|nr:helix-turn-helix domain-containing protein [Ktedonobacterales bacterium]